MTRCDTEEDFGRRRDYIFVIVLKNTCLKVSPGQAAAQKPALSSGPDQNGELVHLNPATWPCLTGLRGNDDVYA
jgi:hypothetical protein